MLGRNRDTPPSVFSRNPYPSRRNETAQKSGKWRRKRKIPRDRHASPRRDDFFDENPYRVRLSEAIFTQILMGQGIEIATILEKFRAPRPAPPGRPEKRPPAPLTQTRGGGSVKPLVSSHSKGESAADVAHRVMAAKGREATFTCLPRLRDNGACQHPLHAPEWP